MRTIAFFNNKGGVGKTTLVYHLAWMLADMGLEVLAVDLDPQSNLTSMCVSEDRLEELWPDDPSQHATILGCLRPVLKGTGDVADPHVEEARPGLGVVPGDLGLSSFEDKLSDAWPRSLDGDEASFRVLSAFHRTIARAAAVRRADVAIIDVGPNLGAINRAALLSSEWVVTPLAPDLFSIQGLRNLGPTLADWRAGWRKRLVENPDPTLQLPEGLIQPAGYVIMQAGMRLNRTVKSYERWVRRAPIEFRRTVPGSSEFSDETVTIEGDEYCLGVLRHYHSLMPLAQDARKPMFALRPGDGAIGAHMEGVRRCREDFERLATRITRKCGLPEPRLRLGA
ncbi:MAG: ParA family protein [Myxococcales bacterium]|nr:ParA family protein [Myxococcales bacterium]